ncbi:MAG: hypothetical protein K6E73_04315 [Bacteroidales bacterium]|nr:hypothetical protein [Bacteroidales bacterium]
MARITPIAVISRMSGKVSSDSDMYFATNKQTGRVYTAKIGESNSTPSEAQMMQRNKFAAKSQLVSEWFAANKPSDTAPNGTDEYQRIATAFKAQHSCGSIRAYVFARMADDGTLTLIS